MSTTSPEIPSSQPDPVETGALASHKLIDKAAKWLFPEHTQVELGKPMKVWDAKAEAEGKAPKPEQSLTPQEQAIVDSVHPDLDPTNFPG